ncbi:MAG: hypothetical protein KAT65_06270 [Methanophagales archaeon]|nr:hypothetical protein [Methanophagales archaeon]
MAAVESTGTSNEIKGHYGKHEKFVRREVFFSPSSFAKTRGAGEKR